jgi:hypothetical protein
LIENVGELSLSSSPTSTPTINPEKIKTLLSFESVVQLDHVDTLNFHGLSFEVLREVLAAIFHTSANHIGKGVVIDFQRRLDESDSGVLDVERRRLNSYPYNTTFVISYPVWFAMKDYPKFNGNGTALYNYLTSIMTDAVSDKSFQDLVHDAAVSLNATQLYQTIVNIIKYQNFHLFNITEAPTEIPSGFPTSVPSGLPTVVPSFAPTSRPSLAPTKKQNNVMLVFHAYFGISNVSAETLSLGGEQSLLDTITDITDVPTNNLDFMGITHELPKNRRKLVDIWDMVVQVKHSIPLKDFPQFNGDVQALFDYLKALLRSSVADTLQGSEINIFTEALRSRAEFMLADELPMSKVFRVEFSDFSLDPNVKSPSRFPTAQPNMEMPTSKPSASDASESLIFQAYWGLDQTTTTTLSPQGQSALLTSMSDVMDIPIADVGYVEVYEFLRRLKARRTRRLTHQLVVETSVIVPYAEFPQFNGNGTKIYLYLTKLLSDSVYEPGKTFENVLRSNAVKETASDITDVVVFEVRFSPFSLFRPTAQPSFAPTASGNGGLTREPTYSPSLGTSVNPSVDPTRSPTQSVAPSRSPSATPTTSLGPTYSPSAVPSTVIPTVSPTRTPIFVLPDPIVSAAPTVTPSTLPIPIPPVSASPSVSPTIHVTSLIDESLVFKAIFYIANLTTTDFSVAEQQALLSVTASISNNNPANGEFLGIRPESRRRLTNFHQLIIATRLSYNVKDYPAFQNASALYDSLEATFADALESKAFTNEFREKAALFDATDALYADILKIEFDDVQIIRPSINSAQQVKVDLSSSDLAAIISATIVGLGMILFFAYIGYLRCYNKSPESSFMLYDSSSSGSGSGSGSGDDNDDYSSLEASHSDDKLDFNNIYNRRDWSDDVMIFVNVQEESTMYSPQSDPMSPMSPLESTIYGTQSPQSPEGVMSNLEQSIFSGFQDRSMMSSISVDTTESRL